MIADLETERLTTDKALQEDMMHDLKDDKALSSLENCEVSQKLLWDLGGQERYLTSHAALMPVPAESKYKMRMYLLVIDISKDLNDVAKSFFRDEGTSVDDPLDLLNIVYNRDFPRHWFTSIGICHPSDVPSPYLGEDLGGVRYPAILIAATHMDKVEKMSNPENFLKRQNAKLDKLIHDLKCQGHIVKNSENGQWFFRVDNTKSGKIDERCEGVKAIISKLDGSSEHYWSKQNKAHPMPLAWIRFELSLVSEKTKKVISVETAVKSSHQFGIKPDKEEEEAKSALKFLHGLGVIFYFWYVPELAGNVIVDPQWLIEAVATFVTAKEPKDAKNKDPWNKLGETGEISRDDALNLLKENKRVEPEYCDLVLHVLQMLDIMCRLPEDDLPENSSTFFIPCMVTKMLKEQSVWDEYDPSQAFPPPIVIFPAEVPIIPEALFFRIVTKFARKYPGLASKLTRNRSIFRIGNNLKLELLYHDKGTCLIVSMTGEGKLEKALSSVPKSATEIREFVAESVEGAKKRGMSGLKLAYYWQVTDKCVFESHVNTGKASCRLPRSGSLVTMQLPHSGVRSSVSPDPLFCISKDGDIPATEEQQELVHRWYKKEVQIVYQLVHR